MRTLCSGLRRARSASTSSPARTAASGSAAAARTAAGRCSRAGSSVRTARRSTDAKRGAEAAARRDRRREGGASCRRRTSRSSRSRMALKNYYELLEIAAAAPADEMKKAFRREIARYHPDKVQHLGQEFQEMAAERAAELTEAYRILWTTARAPSTTRASPRPAAAAPAPRRRGRRAAGAAVAAGRRRAGAVAPPSRRADGPQFTAGAREPRRVRPQGDDQPAAPGASTRSAAATTSRTVARLRHRVACRRSKLFAAQQEAAPARRASCRSSIATRWPTPGRRRRNGATPDATRCACC